MKQLRNRTTLFFLFAAATLFGQPNLDSLSEIGQSAMQAYRYAEARSAFYECHRIDPSNQAYLEKLGYCYLQLGNLQEARTYLGAVLKKDSTHVPTLNYLTNIAEQLLDFATALRHAERLIHLDSTNAYYRRLAGQLCEQRSDPPAAMRHYHQALRLNPGDQQSILAYCKLLTEGGHTPHADSLMESALRKQPKNLRLLYESAKLKYALRKYDDVLAKFQAAFAEGDTNLAYLPVYAYSLAQLERCQEALPWLHLLEKRKGPNEQLHYFQGICYRQLDSLVLSFTHFELAIQAAQSPNIGFYYQLMGDVCGQQKRHKPALKYYELALEHGNSDPAIYFHMATAFDLLNTKDKHKALAFYRRYLTNYDGKKPELKQYADKRVAEIEYYEKHIWKGD